MNAHASPAPASRSARFAVLFTAAVVFTAWFLAAVAKLSEEAVVLSIVVVTFAGSWVATGRTASHRPHRVTVVRLRTPAH